MKSESSFSLAMACQVPALALYDFAIVCEHVCEV